MKSKITHAILTLILLLNAANIFAQGTHLIKDINPGPGSSLGSSHNFFKAGNYVYFDAISTNNNNRDLYRTDGTDAGTLFLATHKNGPQMDLYRDENWVEYDGKIAFVTTGTTNYQDIWVSDGTVAGTQMLPLNIGSNTNNIGELTAFNNNLYFTLTGFNAERGVYKWDGSTITRIVYDNPENNGDDVKLIVGGGKIFYCTYVRIYDITSGNPVQLYDQSTVNSGYIITNPIFYNGKILFNEAIGNIDAQSYGIRMLDPATMQHSPIVQGIGTGFNGAIPKCNTRVEMGGDLYYTRAHYDNTNYYYELRKIDQNFQSSLVQLIQSTTNLMRGVLVANSSKVVFSILHSNAIDGELWCSDGTTAGTFPLISSTDPVRMIHDQRAIAINDSKMFFVGRDFLNNNSQHAHELWTSDFTAAGTIMQIEFAYATNYGVSQDNLAALNNTSIVLAASYQPDINGSPYGLEPWITDGSPITLSVGEVVSPNQSVVFAPNPSTGIVNIEGLPTASTVTIYNLAGQVVYEKATTRKEMVIDLSNQPKSAYFYSISTNGKSLQKGSLVLQ